MPTQTGSPRVITLPAAIPISEVTQRDLLIVLTSTTVGNQDKEGVSSLVSHEIVTTPVQVLKAVIEENCTI